MQLFSQLYPDFDNYWQFEIDSRYTGHTYHLLEQAVEFAKKQPRKYMWERNSYFYAPSVHGSWDSFIDKVNKSMVGRESVWGPLPAQGIEPIGPKPPVAHPADDNYKWGVGEEADLITWLPIYDPEKTEYVFRDKIWNFEQGTKTPRRVSSINITRLSKRLLDVMHQAQTSKGLGLASEMSATSWALFHGLKVVHIPHPLFLDGMWTSQELEGRFNSGPPEKIGGGPDSIWNWNHEHDHILYRFSYMYKSLFPEELYRRWLGYKGDNGMGGKEVSERFI
jgi:hypothetical protein